MRATSLGRTVIDCMRQLGFPEALAVADSYLRATGKSSDQLQAMVSPPRKGARGIRNAQVVARYADGRAESWGESVARAAMIELGFVIPELQTSYVDPVSGMVYARTSRGSSLTGRRSWARWTGLSSTSTRA